MKKKSLNPESDSEPDPDPPFPNPDPDPYQNDTDPQHGFQYFTTIILFPIKLAD